MDTYIDSHFTNITCNTTRDCYPFGSCFEDYCICNPCYLNDYDSDELCNIKLQPILGGFMISLIFGLCGLDHCLMSNCAPFGIFVGILKMVGLGGLGIWWIVDVVLMGTGEFGNVYLYAQPMCKEWVV